MEKYKDYGRGITLQQWISFYHHVLLKIIGLLLIQHPIFFLAETDFHAYIYIYICTTTIFTLQIYY